MLFSNNFNKKINPVGLSPRFKIRASRAALSLLIALVAAIGTNLIVRAAPSILATMTATFFNDVDGDGKADPGDTIEYTAVIQNTGTDATGVTFNDITGLNTTLVAGSLNVSPLALDDTYDTIGNTLLDVGVGLSDPAVHVTNPATDSLFDNDVEFLSDTFTLKSVEADNTAPFTTATESGGSVTVEGDGNFSYTPPVGFSGADHFDYILTDDGPDNILGNADDLTGAGRVTINVTVQRVWYVKNDAVAGGLGRSSDPFDTLVEAQTASAANDTIYVFTGSGTTGQNAGITLKNGQRLLGQGVALTVPVSVNGGPNPTSLQAAGTKPTIGNAAGDGVTLSTVSIGGSFTGVEIRGLNISGTGAGSNAVDVTTSTTFSGSFELADNVISAAGVEGVDVNGGGSGTLTVNLHDNTVTSTGNGIDIARTLGSVIITAFDDNVVMGNSAAAGINVLGTGATVLFDADTGSAGYQQVLGGNTVIGQLGNGVSTFGMSLNNVTGDISFTDLDIYADGGNALLINGTTPNFNAAGSTGFRLVANGNNGTFAAIGGAALDITEANINIVPSLFTSSITTAIRGVSLVNVSGTLTAPAGSTITSTSPTGTGFFVDGGGAFASTSNVNVTYPGTITADIGRLVQIQNVNPTVATIYTFSGAITDNNDGDGNEQGILLDNNDNGTITFSGGLAIRTTSNATFTATNGGTVNVCDENPCNSGATGALINTLTTTTGTALNVANTTIGSNNLEFRNISSNGAVSGIILNTTGTSGGLKVKGNSAGICGGSVTNFSTPGTIATVTAPNTGDCTGGTIQNSSGVGVLLTSTSNVSLTRMNITGGGNDGISGSSVTGLTLDAVNIANNGNADEEHGMEFTNLLGTVSISNTTVTGSYEHNFKITNTSGTLASFTVSGSNFSHTSIPVSPAGGNGFLMTTQGTAIVTTGSISSSVFRNNFSNGVLINSENTSTISTFTVQNSSFDDNNIALQCGQFHSSNFICRFITNTVLNDNRRSTSGTNSTSQAVVVGTSSTSTGGTFGSRIDGNYIGNTSFGGSGSSTGVGIRAIVQGLSDATITITNNVIRECPVGFGMDIESLGSTSGTPPVSDITVTNNNVNHVNIGFNPGTSDFPLPAIYISGDNQGTAGTFRADVTGNTVPSGTAYQFTGAFLELFEYTGPAGDLQLVDTAPASANATAQLTSTNTGSAAASSGVILIAGPINTTAMLPDDNQVFAQNHVETNPNVFAQVPNANLNSANTLAVASASVELPAQASEINLNNTAVNASTTIGGGKPLFRGVQLAPALSGGPVGPVIIGNLPAGKSVTIKYRVTVDNPVTTSRILNQGTVTYTGGGAGVTTTDPTPNADPACSGTTPQTCTPTDRPDTTVASIDRNTPSGANTNASSVTWRVTFADAVSGLTSSNFTLTDVTNSITGEAISSVTAVTGAPDTQWNVTVNTGTTGDGTLRLDLANDTGLSHDVTNSPYTSGGTYIIDKTAPTVTSFTRQTPSGQFTNVDTLIFRATFSEDVQNVGLPGPTGDFTVTGTTAEVTSIFSPGVSGPYDLTVSGGDLASLDGTVGLNFNSANLNITDLAGNALASTEPGIDETYTVDNTAPTVTNVTSTTINGSYTTGTVIPVTVQFNEVVTVTGAPQLTLETGTTDRVVNYTSGSGTSTLTFNYTVQAGDTSADLDYIGTTALALNSGTLIDGVSNNANLTLASPGTAGSLGFNKAIVIDTTAPTVTNVTSTATNGTYTTSAVIPVTVAFSEPVTVTGTPQLTLETSATDAVVNYTSGSGTSTLTFNYTVSAGDTSADLDYVATNSLALNGGTIADAATNNANLTLATPGAAGSLGINKNIVIDGVVPTVINVTSTKPDDSYGTGVLIPITVQFSEAVTVTGMPQITLETGTTDEVVNYSSGSGTDTLTFNLTTQSGDITFDLDYVGTTSLALNGGTIKDAATNNADLTLPAPGAASSLGANKSIVLDATEPTITNITSATANGSYKAGSIIDVTVTFSEAVIVAGTPQLALETGATDSVVDYASGSGTATLTFQYIVASGNNSLDLDYKSTTALSLNGGTIKDVSSNDAILTLPSPGASGSLGANKNIVIDTISPIMINSVTSSAADGSYTTGAVIPISITYSETVYVIGTPQLTLETGATDQIVNYTSGSGTNTLTFNYTVQAGDTSTDLDYKSATALTLNGGSITDLATNNAILTLPAPGDSFSLGDTKNIVIDTSALTVTNITSTSVNGAYTIGVVIPVTVTFNKVVTVTGTPQVTLETGATDEVANYSSGSGTNTLTFNYTAQAGDTSADLDYVSTTSLALNGGAIRDVATNDAVLTLPSPGASGSLGANKDIVIDTDTPNTFIDSSPANPSNSASATFTFHYTDLGPGAVSFVCDLDGSGFTACTSPKNYTGLSDSSHTFQVRAIDNAGNTDATSASYTWIVAAPPIVVSITRANPNPTSALSIDFTVTFSESVTGLDSSDFAITTTGVSGTSVTGVSGSGSTYTITANTGNGNGTIRLDVADDDSIRDAANNPLGGVGTGNGGFNTGETYTINKIGALEVRVAQNLQGAYLVIPQSVDQASYDLNNGPVNVSSTNATKLIASERVIYKVNGANTSFSEMMGLPNSQLSTSYWLPWYNNVDLDTQLRFGNVSGSTATVHVFIGGVEVTPVSGITLLSGQSTRVSYAGVNNGPVQVVSDQNIVVAERVIYKVNVTNTVVAHGRTYTVMSEVNTSFSEMMGLPNSQLSTSYWLPWYNNVDLDTQLRFGNVSGSTATVHVFIGGVEVTPVSGITLLSGQSTRVSYAGVNNGPVQVVSDQNIVVAERVIYKVNGTNTSFSEMMGLPNSQLSTSYWLPWYNNVDLNTQLWFGVP